VAASAAALVLRSRLLAALPRLGKERGPNDVNPEPARRLLLARPKSISLEAPNSFPLFVGFSDMRVTALPRT
jgi:hypothetical protein